MFGKRIFKLGKHAFDLKVHLPSITSSTISSSQINWKEPYFEKKKMSFMYTTLERKKKQKKTSGLVSTHLVITCQSVIPGSAVVGSNSMDPNRTQISLSGLDSGHLRALQALQLVHKSTLPYWVGSPPTWTNQRMWSVDIRAGFHTCDRKIDMFIVLIMHS